MYIKVGVFFVFCAVVNRGYIVLGETRKEIESSSTGNETITRTGKPTTITTTTTTTTTTTATTTIKKSTVLADAGNTPAPASPPDKDLTAPTASPALTVEEESPSPTPANGSSSVSTNSSGKPTISGSTPWSTGKPSPTPTAGSTATSSTTSPKASTTKSTSSSISSSAPSTLSTTPPISPSSTVVSSTTTRKPPSSSVTKSPGSSSTTSQSSSRASTSAAVSMASFTSSSVSMSTPPATTDSTSDSGPTPVTVFVLFLSVICAVVVAGLLVLFVWKKRKDSYIPCTCRSCRSWFDKRTRSSSSGSHGPLTMDDTASIDLSEPRQERELFSIGDQDGGNDGRSRSRARRGTEDDYFYDEVFERSAFVDERTNNSNKRLTIESDDDDELDIPDLIFKKPSVKV